ncbi:MAG: histidinol dehydrogenase [Chloroflexota bacterium]|nr:histidinol dehydrogenase [Chloroflexota bacterium]
MTGRREREGGRHLAVEGGDLPRRVRLDRLSVHERAALVERSAVPGQETSARAREIVEGVRRDGDRALREANDRFGGGLPDGAPLAIPARDLEAAAEALPARVRSALLAMAAAVERFHGAQLPAREEWVETGPGVRVGRVWRPIERVGAYVPGGDASYPSSLVMVAVPARLAGVTELVVATPAGRDGISPVVLGAAGLLGVRELYAMGGAQAVAALAYGTESVRRVDKIVGPGNAWVTAAKLTVFGAVGVDLPAGPSEVMVLADATADPAHAAADLLSQAEHGPDSAAVLVTTDAGLADAIEHEIARQLPALPRQPFLRSSLARAGLIVLAAGRGEAIEFVNAYAPEHLSIVVDDPEVALAGIRHAGSIFVGPFAPESAGDYATGANHVLPTGGLARSFGPLSVESFGKWLQVQHLTREGLAQVREVVAAVAEAEGLDAHRHAVEMRFGEPAP